MAVAFALICDQPDFQSRGACDACRPAGLAITHRNTSLLTGRTRKTKPKTNTQGLPVAARVRTPAMPITAAAVPAMAFLAEGIPAKPVMPASTAKLAARPSHPGRASGSGDSGLNG